MLFYKLSTLVNYSPSRLRSLKAILKFVWSGKPDKIKRFQIILDYEFGGAKSPHIQTPFDALKVGWLRRIIFGDQNVLDCFIQ